MKNKFRIFVLSISVLLFFSGCIPSKREELKKAEDFVVGLWINLSNNQIQLEISSDKTYLICIYNSDGQKLIKSIQGKWEIVQQNNEEFVIRFHNLGDEESKDSNGTLEFENKMIVVKPAYGSLFFVLKKIY